MDSHIPTTHNSMWGLTIDSRFIEDTKVVILVVRSYFEVLIWTG
jgi:hypothetical protein